METTTRQKVMLAGLVAILFAALWLQQRDGPVPGGQAPADGRGGPVVEGGSGAQAVADVRLDLLQAEPGLEAAARNPFAFGVPPPPPPPAPPPATRPAAPAVVRGPVVPPIPLAYIGRIALPQGRGLVAVLSDNRGHVFHGREGDVIEGRYRVLRVGPESVDLAYLDGRGQQTFELSGQ